jgi:succinate dehydrogenase / fumarate reductase membrane anchor subunit
MTTNEMVSQQSETLSPSTTFDSFAWKWMRYSAFLLIPLVWIHAILQALITGGHNLSLDHVQMRWAVFGWRAYDIFLLAFAFSHGVNGLRQVLMDYIKSPQARQILSYLLLVFWLALTAIGAIAVIGGVRVK